MAVYSNIPPGLETFGSYYYEAIRAHHLGCVDDWFKPGTLAVHGET